MTFSELYTMLSSLNGFTEKVAYRSFPEDAAPKLPFIVFEETDTNNFDADNKVYHPRTDFNIYLCEDFRDRTTEEALEDLLNTNDIPWERTVIWIPSERMYQITYEVEV